jgi:hypothetical protein
MSKVGVQRTTERAQYLPAGRSVLSEEYPHGDHVDSSPPAKARTINPIVMASTPALAPKAK